MQHMFGPNGILRKHGKTVIHVTQDCKLPGSYAQLPLTAT